MKKSDIKILAEIGCDRIRMPKVYKAKWLKALRSRNYIQGYGSLYNEGRMDFCCLGVLQHCLTGGVEYDPWGRPENYITHEWAKDWNISQKQNKNHAEYQLYYDLTFVYTNFVRTASELNDLIGLSFNEIADIIEDQIIGI